MGAKDVSTPHPIVKVIARDDTDDPDNITAFFHSLDYDHKNVAVNIPGTPDAYDNEPLSAPVKVIARDDTDDPDNVTAFFQAYTTNDAAAFLSRVHNALDYWDNALSDQKWPGGVV